jgi:two-component system, chemotaxis family, protein-glutamate methylesterase/glutaminase
VSFPAGHPAGAVAAATPAPPGWRSAGLRPERFLVVIGASTGGTEAVRRLLAVAPPDFPATAIVQHMPVLFTRAFAERLNQCGRMRVSEAADGDVIGPGQVVIARGDTHLVVRRAGTNWRVHYTDQVLVNRHCPSVDVLFASATAAGRDVIGILLTGMGDDGARGLLQLRKSGALTLGQDEASSVVYGMPKVAVQNGAVAYQARPEQIPELVRSVLVRQMNPAARPVDR